MTLPPANFDETLHIYLALAQYPVLCTPMRARMRRELFQRGVISPQQFEAEVREKAIQSQVREGMHDPFSEEPSEIWEMRLTRIREHLTDFYFAYNLPLGLFEQIIRETLSERGAHAEELLISFNPELAPQDVLFEQAAAIEKLPSESRRQMEARLREIKVVLIRTLISDQLAYVNIAKEWFTMSDLDEIRRRKIGSGKVGGKAAGMLLAYRILQEKADAELRGCVRLPESFFLGADLTYSFMAINQLFAWGDQKYKSDEQIRADYPLICSEFQKGSFPDDAVERFEGLLANVGARPLIVRSSSLLEDNFGFSFAGKYESHFLPNQGSATVNLAALTKAIISIYSSVFNPNALLYRRAKGLLDYDERMAVLIQVVEGSPMGDAADKATGKLAARYWLPHAAGVGFSRNLYRWSPQIRREDGFLRLVWGLGTRAVDRVGNDHPRMVALSHPLLRPESSARTTRRYSQQFVDLIDMEENAFKSLPVHEAFDTRYPVLRYLAQVDEGDYLATPRSTIMNETIPHLVLTFDELLRRTPFANRMKRLLHTLETHYRSPVDTEFTVEITDPLTLKPDVKITILQCRPQSHLKETEADLPINLNPADIVFSTHGVIPQGMVKAIEYVVFIPPEGYFALPTQAARSALARTIGKLNEKLAGKTFICIGPGRWGTNNPDLGVGIGYADIYNSRALVELSGKDIGVDPEASFGTHFFQDLVEANIYPLAIHLDEKGIVFNRDFFYTTPNQFGNHLPGERFPTECIRLIAVRDFRPEHHLDLSMSDERNQAIAFLVPDWVHV
ncbi:MAG: PEP/pyruvate-binding domain-containing protein [Chloroflexota bacterium]